MNTILKQRININIVNIIGSYNIKQYKCDLLYKIKTATGNINKCLKDNMCFNISATKRYNDLKNSKIRRIKNSKYNVIFWSIRKTNELIH